MQITDKASAQQANSMANAEFHDAILEYERATAQIGSPEPLDDTSKKELLRLQGIFLTQTLPFLNRKISFTMTAVGYYQAREWGQPHDVPDGTPYGISVRPFAGDLPPVPATGPIVGDDIGFPAGRQFAAARRKGDGTVEVDDTPDGVTIGYAYQGTAINLKKIVIPGWAGKSQWWTKVP
jgi:hypothetical protein